MIDPTVLGKKVPMRDDNYRAKSGQDSQWRMIWRVGGRLIDQAFDPGNARHQSLEACNHTYDFSVPCLFRLSTAFSTMPIGNNIVGQI